jgi:NitT/TauT family transport system permease protein
MGLLLFQISDLAAVFATAGVLIPILSQDFSQAAKNLDPHLSELASVFNIRPFARLRYIVLPQLLPAIFAVARYGLSLSWKVVIIAEVFGLSNGVGYQINYNYGLLRIDGVFAWTLVFAFIMFLIEYGLLYPLERYAFRWRHSIHNLP